MNASRENFLHRVSVMAGLDDEAVHFLSELAREEQYPAGAVIVGEGEPGNRMFFLSAGHVSVVKEHGAAQPVVLARLGPGEFFGEMSLVESVVRSASVVADDAVTACTLKGTDFHRLYCHRPDQYGIVILNLARDLSRRLRALDERFAHISH
jgi:CRP/FNR family cyclic AMP-dependent transcriptional regulator